MPRIAYEQPGARGSAFTPFPAYDGRNLGPWQNGAAVSGQPGTQGVPAGLPDFGDDGLTANGVSVRGGGAGYASGSGTMRSRAWYPSLYYLTRLDGAALTIRGEGVSVYSDNQMPVPAASPLGRAALTARPPVFLGQRNLRQPAGSKGPAWPSWLPRLGYGG